MIKRLWYSLLSNDKPQDKNVIWIDTSNSESFTLKLYRNGGWKPLQVVGTSRDMIERELTGYVTSHYHSYDRIINKPTTLEGYGITDCFNKKEVEKLLDNKVTKVDGMSLTSNNFSDKYKKILDNLSTSYYDKGDIDNLFNNKQDIISDLDSIREGAKKGSTALQSFTETDPIYLKDKPFIALKSDLLNDNNLVHKEGDEDIKGSKWFEHIRTNNFGIFQEDNHNHSVYIDYHYDESNYLPILHFSSEEDWLTILDNIADPVDDFHAANKHYVDESLTTKQDVLTDTDGGYGQRVAELEKEGIVSQEKLTELEVNVDDLNGDSRIYQGNSARNNRVHFVAKMGDLIEVSFEALSGVGLVFMTKDNVRVITIFIPQSATSVNTSLYAPSDIDYFYLEYGDGTNINIRSYMQSNDLQIKDLLIEKSNFVKVRQNLVGDYGDFKDNYFINPSSKQYQAYSGAFVSPVIPVKNGKTYFFNDVNAQLGSSGRYVFRSVGEGLLIPISCEQTNGTYRKFVCTFDGFIRFNCHNAFRDVVMFVEGTDYPTAYIPKSLEIDGLKLADSSVDTTNIKDGAITKDKLSEEVKSGIYETTAINIGQSVAETYISGASAYKNQYSATYTSTADIVPVEPNREIKIEHLCLGGNISLSYYNKSRQYVAVIAQGTGETDQTYTFVTPPDCYGLKFTWLTSNTPSIYYTSSRNAMEVIEDMKSGSFGELMSKFGIDTENLLPVLSKPMFTLVDDDGSENIPTIKSICDTLGIKCTFGVITTPNFADSARLNLLKAYQSEGFHITSHSATHSTFWDDGNDYNLASIETDIINSLVALNANGFIDSDYLVTPWGQHNADVQMLAKKWCKCLVGASATYNKGYDGGRFYIQRLFIRNTNTLDYYKGVIDECYANGGWLIFGTHSGMSDEFDATLVQSVLSYAKTKGDFYTLNAGFKERKPVYELHDLLN